MLPQTAKAKASTFFPKKVAKKGKAKDKDAVIKSKNRYCIPRLRRWVKKIQNISLLQSGYELFCSCYNVFDAHGGLKMEKIIKQLNESIDLPPRLVKVKQNHIDVIFSDLVFIITIPEFNMYFTSRSGYLPLGEADLIAIQKRKICIDKILKGYTTL